MLIVAHESEELREGVQIPHYPSCRGPRELLGTNSSTPCHLGEIADAVVSKAAIRKDVGVQIPQVA